MTTLALVPPPVTDPAYPDPTLVRAAEALLEEFPDVTPARLAATGDPVLQRVAEVLPLARKRGSS